MNRKILCVFSIVLFIGCKSDPVIDWELRESSKSLVVNVFALPNEPWGGTETYTRRVYFYSSYEDMLSKTNEIDIHTTRKGYYGQMRSVDLMNVEYDTIYIRLKSIENEMFTKGHYRYDKAIVMSPHYGETIFIVKEVNLIRE